ncbi:MAG: ABC transporter ATP-binding protein [Deferrisomatales bacterium]
MTDPGTPEGRGPVTEPVLELENVEIAYETRSGSVPAVRGVSLSLGRGEALGVVGESGCGKSTLAYGIVNFLGRNGRIAGGDIRFQGRSLTGISERELRAIRGNRVAMVYQDPMQALNPVLRIGDQLAEVLTVHQGLPKAEALDRARAMLGRVHMPDAADVLRRYPHQLSGGQQQRVVIAMAMLNEPDLLILDEPTTALDVTVEAAVLDLVEELQETSRTAILFITHNLGVVARVSDRLAVMYAGEIVESGPTRSVFRRPTHPYTRGLLRAVPRLGHTRKDEPLVPIPGRVPPPAERPADACGFAPRCEFVREACRSGRPPLAPVAEGHESRCFFAAQAAEAPLRKASKRPIQAPMAGEGLLRTRDLRVYYRGRRRDRPVRAVDGVDLDVYKGRILGIVGESGCGKSSLVKALIGLERPTGGEAEFLGVDLREPVTRRSREAIRGIQMVFQNPDATLNPSYSVGSQVARAVRKLTGAPRRRARDEALRLLRAVKLGSDYFARYPRQLSGGEKQRVGIARALAGRPDLVLCDEPVSALDVSVQAAVLNLLAEIQQRHGTALAFIAHDLSVVRYFCDDLLVMYLGGVVEEGPSEAIYAPPYHPYTEALLSAVPVPDPDAKQQKLRLEGPVPSAVAPPPGCRFHTRCPRRALLPDGGAVCGREEPPWREAGDGHRIRCHLPLETLEGLEPAVIVAA